MNEKTEFRPATAVEIIDAFAHSGSVKDIAPMCARFDDIESEIQKAKALYSAALYKIGELCEENDRLERTHKFDFDNTTAILKENTALKERVDELEKRNDILFQKVKALHDEREQSFAYRFAKYLKE